MPSQVGPNYSPTHSRDRIAFVDLLRGFAVMAIFVVNIKAMVMPYAFYLNPSLWTTDTDQFIALLHKYLVDDKWRTIFTALYGAGLMMMWDRLASRGANRSVLVRRTAWLALFGALHLFGLWMGDILFMYGTVGFLAILFLTLRTRTLLITGVVILLLGTAWVSVFAAGPVFEPELRAELKPLFWAPTTEQIAEEVARQNGPWWPRLTNRVVEAVDYLLFYFLLGGFWLVTLGIMLMGMVLYRTGLFRGQWSARVTLLLSFLFLGAAWTLDGLQISDLTSSNYDFDRYSLNQWKASLDGYLGGFGFCCLISTLANSGIRIRAVQAVGRMAFSNYIVCTLIGTTLGVGHGFGLYGDIQLASLMLIVLVSLTAMLVWSSAWLQRFRFGPLEWLWRSLVYGERQPMHRVTNHDD
ncbi:MAG: DUF418 domain-containing protein [Pseudomonadota bacterium]